MEPRGKGRGLDRRRGRGQQPPTSGGQPRPGPSGGPQQPSAWREPVQPRPGPSRGPQQPSTRGEPGQPRSGPSTGPQQPNAWGKPGQPRPGTSGGQQSSSCREPGQIEAWPRIAPPLPQQQSSTTGVGRGAGGEAPTCDELAGAVQRKLSIRGRVVDREIIYTRPESCVTKQGTTGTPITVHANYLSFAQSEWSLYQYHVDFAPDIDSTSDRKALVRTAVKEIIKGGYIFDGSVLYCPQKLHPDVIELFAQTPNKETIKITIKLVGDVSYGDKHYLQIFNLIMRKCLKLLDLQQVGRYFYLPQLRENLLEHKLQIWPGFFTSIRQHESQILLNVDLQSKVMRTDTVYNMLCECQSANIRREFQSKIIGGVVLTVYNNKTYRIDDVDFDSTPLSTFTKVDGSKITYEQYFKERYNCVIKVKDQPMLVSRRKARELRLGSNMGETIYLVPELCLLTGLSERQRENFQLMRTLAAYTRIGPGDRLRRLQDFANKLARKREVVEEIQRWDLKIASNLVEIKARVLPNETILVNNNRLHTTQEADWTNNLRNNAMLYNGKLQRLVVLTPHKYRQDTETFINYLKKATQGMNWRLGHIEIVELSDDRSSTYVEKIDLIINKYRPDLILVVLPNNSLDRYSAIKKKCSVDRGIPTQMIVARNLASKGRNTMLIATKLGIQLNCKVGGGPWGIHIPLGGLMVVGYDVCRDTANKKLSFCGMVATLDRHLTRCYSAAYQHEVDEELSSTIAQFLVVACKKYQKVNGAYPENIIIYRDGVGEGQLNFVFKHEVENIKNLLQTEIYNNQEPKFTFIVVSKRINTRFFSNKANPPPGTVVDDVVTLPHRSDFFLVSQCVRQGTVTPTHYNVIHDAVKLGADRLQILTYKMTHMYFNWSGTVRVPATCQNAHKLAFLTSTALHRPAHHALSDILHFL